MKNRDMPAKPCQEFNQGHCNTDLSTGLTKLEYAAIQIMACASSNSYFAALTHKEQSKWAINQANTLFDELEKQ